MVQDRRVVRVFAEARDHAPQGRVTRSESGVAVIDPVGVVLPVGGLLAVGVADPTHVFERTRRRVCDRHPEARGRQPDPVIQVEAPADVEHVGCEQAIGDAVLAGRATPRDEGILHRGVDHALEAPVRQVGQRSRPGDVVAGADPADGEVVRTVEVDTVPEDPRFAVGDELVRRQEGIDGPSQGADVCHAMLIILEGRRTEAPES